MTTKTLEQLAYKVADISLAASGEKIEIAEKEMRMWLSGKSMQPPNRSKAARVMGSLHMTIQTAVLIETG